MFIYNIVCYQHDKIVFQRLADINQLLEPDMCQYASYSFQKIYIAQLLQFQFLKYKNNDCLTNTSLSLFMISSVTYPGIYFNSLSLCLLQ